MEKCKYENFANVLREYNCYSIGGIDVCETPIGEGVDRYYGNIDTQYHAENILGHTINFTTDKNTNREDRNYVISDINNVPDYKIITTKEGSVKYLKWTRKIWCAVEKPKSAPNIV